jgi:hypothetical protein
MSEKRAAGHLEKLYRLGNASTPLAPESLK